jgi:predicted nucleotidyltransferase component of viral defense system
MNVFDNMLSRYEIKTNEDYSNALHEVMQQITLAGLYRGGFFEYAAFYGGTCLRIFHQLQRFSEDMDFSLLQPNKDFRLEDYFTPIINEFGALGREVVINKKSKKSESNIESAFLKDDTAIYNLQFRTERNIKIKIELDVNPPLGFSTEPKLLLLPYSFMTRCYTMPCLFAGKMHALMYRKWNNRVKGRDWYDFEWYVRNGVALDFEHFCQRTQQFQGISNESISQELFRKILKEKIAGTNIEQVKADVRPFIKDASEMNIWSVDYFTQLVDMMKIS